MTDDQFSDQVNDQFSNQFINLPYLILEIICKYLHPDDIINLSLVNKSLYKNIMGDSSLVCFMDLSKYEYIEPSVSLRTFARMGNIHAIFILGSLYFKSDHIYEAGMYLQKYFELGGRLVSDNNVIYIASSITKYNSENMAVIVYIHKQHCYHIRAVFSGPRRPDHIDNILKTIVKPMLLESSYEIPEMNNLYVADQHLCGSMRSYKYNDFCLRTENISIFLESVRKLVSDHKYKILDKYNLTVVRVY